MTWQADARVLCCGDLFIWASPNAGNPQKVQRYPAEWAEALRRMVALDAEFLLPGHGFPVVGADRVRQALTDTADLLDSLVDQTLALMNAGARLDEAIHTVRPPEPPGGPARTSARSTTSPSSSCTTSGACTGAGGTATRPRSSRRPSGPWPPSWPPWPAGPAPWPTGPWLLAAAADAPESERRARPTGPCGWPATWPSWPGWPTRPTRASSGRASEVFAARADRATSTMARGVFTWAASESSHARAGDRGDPHAH